MEDNLTVVSRGAGVSITVTGGGAGEKDEGDRGLFCSFFLFFFFFYIIYLLLRYKKSHGGLAMAKTKPTELTTHTCITPSWEKANPVKTRERPLPIQHPSRNQDEAVPSSRHLRKIIEMKPEQDKTHWWATKTKERNLTAHGRRRGKGKSPIAGSFKRKMY